MAGFLGLYFHPQDFPPKRQSSFSVLGERYFVFKIGTILQSVQNCFYKVNVQTCRNIFFLS
jgi:hypothetical protein